jgi:riboflavin synthase
MFTGIVEATGEVTAVEADEDGRRLTFEAPLDDLHHGQSIAVSGTCLTVEEYGPDWFELFVSQETLERTYLDDVDPGDLVNVERALAADGRFDGHVVQGHVDATAEVTAIEALGDGPASGASGASSSEGAAEEYDGDWTFQFSIPDGLGRYIVEKGSVTVDGISLTVADLSETDFAVAIIPASYELTTLSEKSVGDPVHLEVDVVAKYVESMLACDGDAPQSPYAARFEE